MTTCSVALPTQQAVLEPKKGLRLSASTLFFFEITIVDAKASDRVKLPHTQYHDAGSKTITKMLQENWRACLALNSFPCNALQ